MMKNKKPSPSVSTLYFSFSLLLGFVGFGCFISGLVGDVKPDNLLTRSAITLFGVSNLTAVALIFTNSIDN